METRGVDQAVRKRPMKFWQGYHLENIALTTLVDSTQEESDTDKSPDIE
ncbi:hypothetical protein THARTR1_11133 [Trichoderma harzianum]|uniref:Uncharacterized protein n=1 Tax=Trichoderma harzianum TaxID=5544 RepID=A0A2K0TCI0_TRIHA|nr:hypothetical protein THARTR1_11133 [Trichoderma harzianum]